VHIAGAAIHVVRQEAGVSAVKDREGLAIVPGTRDELTFIVGRRPIHFDHACSQ